MYMFCGTWREILNSHHENRVKDVFKIPSYSKLNKRWTIVSSLRENEFEGGL